MLNFLFSFLSLLGFRKKSTEGLYTREEMDDVVRAFTKEKQQLKESAQNLMRFLVALSFERDYELSVSHEDWELADEDWEVQFIEDENRISMFASCELTDKEIAPDCDGGCDDDGDDDKPDGKCGGGGCGRCPGDCS